MATTFKHSPVRPAVWTTWAPSMGILCVVGAHVLAATLGLYTSAPGAAGLAPASSLTSSLNGRLEIAVRSSELPPGAEVRRLEYQLDSPSGAWVPLTFEHESMTYRGGSELPAGSTGQHALYLRASDPAGNLRTVSITVTVDPEVKRVPVSGAPPRPEAAPGIPQG